MAKGRVRVYLGCSLDGCIAGLGHDISFLHELEPDPKAPQTGLSFEAFLADVGALLMGRRTYQVPLDYDAWHYGSRTRCTASIQPVPGPPCARS